MYEHKILRVNNDLTVTEQRINEASADGWEHYSSDGTMLFFRRLKNAPMAEEAAGEATAGKSKRQPTK